MNVIALFACMTSLLTSTAGLHDVRLPGFIVTGNTSTTDPKMVLYTFYEEKVTWNVASKTCQQNGGHLAVVQSEEVKAFLIDGLKNTNHDGLRVSDYWVGLFELIHTLTKWAVPSKCPRCTSNIRDYYYMNWRDGYFCFVWRTALLEKGYRERCDMKHGFICQTHTENDCQMKESYSSDATVHYVYDWFHNSKVVPDADVCQKACMEKSSCTDAVYKEAIICILTQRYHSSAPHFKTFSKYCLEVKVNASVGNDTTDTDIMPRTDCATTEEYLNASAALRTTSLPTVSSTIEPACLCPTTTPIPSCTTKCPVCPSETTASPTNCSLCPETPVCPTRNTGGQETAGGQANCPVCPTATPACPPVPTCPILTSKTTTTHVPTTNTTTLDPGRSAIDIDAIVQNLTIDARRTSAFTRKLRCAGDDRQSAYVMGWLGVVSIGLPMVIIMSSDFNIIYSHIRDKVHK